MSDVLVCLLASQLCIVNSWDRPDQKRFWFNLSIFCDFSAFVVAVFSA